jgi:hypothetical protein
LGRDAPGIKKKATMKSLAIVVRDKSFQLLAVNMGVDTGPIFEFLGSYPMRFPALRDKSGEIITTRYQAQSAQSVIVSNRRKYSSLARFRNKRQLWPRILYCVLSCVDKGANGINYYPSGTLLYCH